MQEPVYVLHLITCHGRIMPRLAELLLMESSSDFAGYEDSHKILVQFDIWTNPIFHMRVTSPFSLA